MDIALACAHLLPDAQYRMADNYENLARTWFDSRPIPTEQELQTAWDEILSQLAAENQRQQRGKIKQEDAVVRAESIPGWATWTEAEALAWITANISDTEIDKITSLADALLMMKKQNTAITALIRMVLALRDHAWPNLGEE